MESYVLLAFLSNMKLSACSGQSFKMWGLNSFMNPKPRKLSSPVSCLSFASAMMFCLLEGSCMAMTRFL